MGYASCVRKGSHDSPLILDLMQGVEPLFHGLVCFLCLLGSLGSSVWEIRE